MCNPHNYLSTELNQGITHYFQYFHKSTESLVLRGQTAFFLLCWVPDPTLKENKQFGYARLYREYAREDSHIHFIKILILIVVPRIEVTQFSRVFGG